MCNELNRIWGVRIWRVTGEVLLGLGLPLWVRPGRDGGRGENNNAEEGRLFGVLMR